MKKIMAMLVAASVAGVAAADISVTFQSGSIPVLKPGETVAGATTLMAAGSLVQLVWSAGNAGYQSDNLDISLVNPGEYILAQGFAGNAGIFVLGNVIATDADVGGVDVNTGYFFARIFDSAAPVAGSSFLEMGLTGSSLKEFNPGPPVDANSVYTDPLNNIGTTAIDAQTYVVVPEPATFGLMGVAGLGLFLARKKARR